MYHKTLVAYFSATGTTAKAAKKLAEAAGADLYEIKPQIPYSHADLNWMDPKSRTSLERKNPAIRSEIEEGMEDIAQYDEIFIGFPIWWYTAPNIIHTFLESFDWKGKRIIPFATSGGSNLGNTCEDLQKSCPGATVVQGKMLNGSFAEETLQKWIVSLQK